jgi:hypothetical protein
MLTSRLKAASSVLTLEFRSSSISTISTIAVPNDVVAGDLLVLCDRATNNSGSGFPTAVVPTGFTQILNQTGSTNVRFVCSFKIAVGTEAGTNITGMNGANNNNKILIVFSTNNAISASSFDVAFENTDGDPAAQTVNASGQPTPLVVLAFMRQQTVTGQSFSPSQDGTVVNSAVTGYYKIYNSLPSDVTVDCGDGGTLNALMSFYIEIS